MYAKINESGYPVFLTKHYVKAGSKLILNPTEDQLRQLGYKPLKKQAPPSIKEGSILTVSYVDSGDYIEEIYGILEA